MKLRMGPTNDSPDLVRVMKKIGSIPIKAVLADKGYDSELNREYVKAKGADVHIPVRGADRRGIRIRGRHRKRQMEEFDRLLYNQRASVESVFSSIKRGMRDDVLSRRAVQEDRHEAQGAGAQRTGVQLR